MSHIKSVLVGIAGAALLAGCAAGPYYQDPGYGYQDPGYGYAPGYVHPYDDYGPTYYGAPGYVGPSVGFGITYIDRDDNDRRHWRDNRGRDGHDYRREGRGDRDGDGRRGDRDGRNDRGHGSGG